MTIDLESLKRAAEAVWSRPNWRAAMGHVEADETEDYPRIDINCKAGNQDDAKRLSRFIALANPATILQLIARLEASERDGARYRYLRSEHTVNLGEPFIGRQNLIGAFSRWTEEHADAAIDAQIAARKE